MNNIVYGKTIKNKLAFRITKKFFKMMNNSVYGETTKNKTNPRFNNAKKHKAYKNEFLGWKRSKRIVSRTSILK